jgi:undecaprenyl-diphosphatase
MTSLGETRPHTQGWGRALRTWCARLVRPERSAARRIRRFERRHLATGALALVLLLLGLLVFADAVAITAARQLPPMVQQFFNIITDYGKSGWVLWPLGIFLALSALAVGFASNRAKRLLGSLAVRALFLFTAVAIPGIAVNIIKGFIGRARPFVGGVADPYLFKTWTWVPAYASFPSGHATAAASIAFAFGAIWPKWRIPLWIYAGLIVASRVVVTAHHPTDVAAGVIFGVAGAWLVRRYFAARSLGFAVDRSGAIHPFAGPSWQRIKRVAAHPFAQ